jgi:hypothetical protein
MGYHGPSIERQSNATDIQNIQKLNIFYIQRKYILAA